ncbi:MAG: hypothetical protein ACW99U_07095 [Candidatus Thorarchaeota archaeon]|jgi:hypothetical protein
MTGYITKVSFWFSSEGASPADVIRRLLDMGFTPVRGAYDFIYHHESAEGMSDSDLSSAILEISDALHAALSGFKVFYTMSTHPADELADYVPLADIDAELEATRAELRAFEGDSFSDEE